MDPTKEQGLPLISRRIFLATGIETAISATIAACTPKNPKKPTSTPGPDVVSTNIASIKSTQKSPDYNQREAIEAQPENCRNTALKQVFHFPYDALPPPSSGTLITILQRPEGGEYIVGSTAGHVFSHDNESPVGLDLSQPQRPEVPLLKFPHVGTASSKNRDFGVFIVYSSISTGSFNLIPLRPKSEISDYSPAPEEELFGIAFPQIDNLHRTVVTDPATFHASPDQSQNEGPHQVQTDLKMVSGGSGMGVFTKDGHYVGEESAHNDRGAVIIQIPDTQELFDLVKLAAENLERKLK